MVTKPVGTLDRVNAAIVHRKFTFLSGGEKRSFEREGRMPQQGFFAEQGCVAKKSVLRAVRTATGVELRPNSKGLESPSNPTGVVVVTGAGLRAGAKAPESPPYPTATRAARLAVTSGVMGQKSAEAIVARKPGQADG
jgi:hypothetical protein